MGSHIIKWITAFIGVVFLTFPLYNLGKGTSSFSDSALYLVAQYTPKARTLEASPKGGLEDLADVESEIFDNTFMPLALPPQAQGAIEKGIISYTVKENDTVGGIASAFRVKLTTILWANNLSAKSLLKPGQTLTILPVDGVLHQVKRGQTLSSISLVYKVYTEDIIGVNNLSANGLIFANQDLIIPGASPLPVAPRSPFLQPGFSERIIADVRGTFVNPAPGSHRSQGLHWRNAVDLANGCANPVVAAATGTILEADPTGWNGGFGKYIIIKHPTGVVTVYGHLSEIFVEAGQEVGQGQRIGSVGATGHATGCHVHFEVRGAINPFGY